ncbi:MAG: antibiotic biosynthesis monooxygenase [Anaerolineae bacterium]|nr:antibiotic biosynthesis monooxygenase [Anaerolineae bacterium]
MILIHVTVKTKEETTGEFERTLRQVVTNAHKTAGCVKYEWYPIPDMPQGYVIYGEFDSKENFKKYLNSDVVKRIGDELIPLLDGPPKFKHYEATVFEGN